MGQAKNVIHIACDGRDCKLTGSINEQAQSVSALIKSRPESLEITCASDHCTIRINDETINRSRVKRMRAKRRWRFAPRGRFPCCRNREGWCGRYR